MNMDTPERNWAGNYTYTAARIHRPETVEQIQEIVGGAARVRALGTRHSFNSIADTPDDLISTEKLNRVVSLDPARRTITVEGGIRYGQVGQYLHEHGWALPNMASLPHISVAGACATATHGSGNANGNLATAVNGLEIVTAGGELLSFSRDSHGEEFNGMVVSLGGLGIVTKVTLDIVPTFLICQNVYENLPMSQLEKNYDAIAGSAYSVSFFTDWREDRVNQVWLKSLASDDPKGPQFFGATLAPVKLHPIREVSAINTTPQLGNPGPAYERLPHFRMEYTPSSGQELQSEYFIPRRHAVVAILAIAESREKVSPLLMISELRTIAADELWMSPCYRQACAAIHFTWKPDWPGVRSVLPIIEERLAPFEARPHWGKLFTMSPARLRALYPKLPAFKELLRSQDPKGKFRNPFLNEKLFDA
jgi:xylitol oxidase